jgi:hypothetical protein
MGKTTIEIEFLIREIDELKNRCYESFDMHEGLADPEVLAQVSQKLFGAQIAYDSIIRILRKEQGSDAE